MQNMQTRIAQMAASGTAAAWKQHRSNCPSCSSKVRVNCAKGDRLYQDANKAAAELATARKLDKAVPLGQGVLFGQGTLI